MLQGQAEPQDLSRVHFIGVGGVGMSGIALVLHNRGYKVSGSDLHASKYTRQLEAQGIPIYYGHNSEVIDLHKPEVVVISSAIPEKNVELARARDLGVAVWQRAKMLAYISRGQKTIAFAGTHGKTTSSSMAAVCFDKLGLEPSFLIGGMLNGYETNGVSGAGEFFICEADESDGSFLNLDPFVIVISNIEADHLDFYDSLDEIYKTFGEFIEKLPDDGFVVANYEQKRTMELIAQAHKRVISFGFDPQADVSIRIKARNSENPLATHFELSFPDGRTIETSLPQSPGNHNILNAASVLTAAYGLGVDLLGAARALQEFKGAHRRFDFVAQVNDIVIVDDYAHHPTEISATLKAASELSYRHVHVVFQPHRYTRTMSLLKDFGEAFNDADSLSLLDIYAAGEPPIPGVTSKAIVREVQRSKEHADVSYFPQWETMVNYIAKKAQPGDLIITMGAGDITRMGHDIQEVLVASYAQTEDKYGVKL
ncbi:MAG: UDP-N-acetylmuramate--L-alanine ligase [Coriobacteriia bacterium]|nr:UDP-N-acetylmuramate--L-alanine ligase [Coriobacteriia bacterium]